MAGLDTTGFTPKTYTEIKTSVNTTMKPVLGAGTESETENVYAYLRNIFSFELADAWEAIESVYNQRGINKAEGIQLDNETSITGIKRKAATYSTVTVDVEGSEGATIAQYFQLSVASTGDLFQTTQSYTLPETASQPLQIEMQSVDKGAIVCLAGELTGTLPSGVTSMVNNDDAEVGNEQETDEEYRLSYPVRLEAIGGTSLSAIVAALESEGWIAYARQNVTNYIDSNGLPAHSVQCIVEGGTDSEVAAVIFEQTAAGIETYGDITENVTYKGNTYPINFSRPTGVTIYVAVVITETNDDFPTDGLSQILQNILDYGDTLSAGDNVLLSKMQNAVTDIDGIVSYTLAFDTVTPPVNTTGNLSIDITEYADFESANISVT